MRTPPISVVATLLFSLAACSSGSTSPTGTNLTVTPGLNEVIATSSNTFNPTSLTVGTGTTVTFTFQGVTHNVTFDVHTGVPANIGDSANKSVTRAFDTAGSFGFTCTIHPTMRGTVVVH